MTPAESLAIECPRKILAILHARGLYRHCYHPLHAQRMVCCYHRESPMPAGAEPTEAQQALEADREVQG